MPNLFRPTSVPVGSGFINKNKVPYGINPLQHHTFVCLLVAETRLVKFPCVAEAQLKQVSFMLK